MRLLTWLSVAADTVSQTILPGVEVRVLRLFLSFQFLKNLSLLLLREFFSIDTSVLGLHCSESFSVLLFFLRSRLSRRLLLNLGWFNVVLWSFEIDFNVRLDAADLIIWLGLNDVDCVVATTILNVNRVTLVKDRVMSQLLLQAIDIIEIISQVRGNEFKAYMALGLDKSMKAVSWGLIFTYEPFYRFMFLRIISVPSSTHRLFIIQIGIWHMPSSAENSSTPQ